MRCRASNAVGIWTRPKRYDLLKLVNLSKNVKPLATAILVNQISRASLCVHTLNFTQKKNYYSKCCWNERDISRSMGGYRILILHTKKEKMKLEVFVETITFQF